MRRKGSVLAAFVAGVWAVGVVGPPAAAQRDRARPPAEEDEAPAHRPASDPDGAGGTASDSRWNGSFEDGLAGWSSADVVVEDHGSAAFHGNRVLAFDPAPGPGLQQGHVERLLATRPGHEYLLSFAYQTGFASGEAKLSVTLDGRSPYDALTVLYLNHPGTDRSAPESGAWIQRQVSFFAEHELTRLRIGPLTRWTTNVGWGKVWVDHVRVAPLGRELLLGRDFELRATLPSDAVAGELVDLHVVALGTLRTEYSGLAFDRRPYPVDTELALMTTDGAAEVLEVVSLQTGARRFRIRFHSLGARAVTLRTPGGYQVRSNPVLVSAAPPAERRYWGDVHIHTEEGHSDWIGGSGADNYRFARDFAALDFAALSEHFPASAAVPWMTALGPPTIAFDDPGRFVTFIASEAGSYEGHHNFYLRSGDPLDMYDPRDPLRTLGRRAADLRGRGVPFLVVPHHFMLFDPFDWRVHDRDSLRVAEIYSNHGSSEEAGEWWRHPAHFGNNYSDTRGAEGHDYLTALRLGHRIGVIGCSDDHTARPGLVGLTCAVADGLDRASLFDALEARRCYATTGARILLEYSLAGARMGEEATRAPGSALTAELCVDGSDVIERVEVVRDGSVVAQVLPSSFHWEGALDLGTLDDDSTWAYVRVFQRDEHRAWSSPVWIDAAGKPDLVLEEKDLAYDHAAGALTVTPRNYGSTAAAATLRVFSSASESLLAEVDLLGMTEPALILRAEPVNAGRIRLQAVLFSPANQGATFLWTGELRIFGAAGYEVVRDGREMLNDDGAGRLTWSEILGHGYRGPESKAGRITSFEVVVDATSSSSLVLSPRIDGAPLPTVYLGDQPFPAPSSLSIPLAGVLGSAPVAEVSISLGPDASGTHTFALPPGETYIAVVDPEEVLDELAEHNNAAHLAIPAVEAPVAHWPDF